MVEYQDKKLFQYNICTCGALALDDKIYGKNFEFQYNICTCGAGYKQETEGGKNEISIQHLYMWSL